MLSPKALKWPAVIREPLYRRECFLKHEIQTSEGNPRFEFLVLRSERSQDALKTTFF
jgi:hypothetical protein